MALGMIGGFLPLYVCGPGRWLVLGGKENEGPQTEWLGMP